MKKFKQQMRDYQETWRQKHLPSITENGWHNGRQYVHVLPKESFLHNFYPPIQHELFDKTTGYIDRKSIQTHTGIHNLLSSWALCANMYWAFNNPEGFNLLAQYLRDKTDIDIQQVTGMELEYEEQDDPDLLPQALLGENSGSRGSGQTSPDLAIKFNTKEGRKGIFLIESKFTEHSFYGCSGYKKTKVGKEKNIRRPSNPDNRRCHNTAGIIASNFTECHLVASGWNRKYWDLLKDKIDKEKYASLKKCPMSNCSYQLFRQQALAQGFRKKYDVAISCVATDNRNDVLVNSSQTTGLSKFPKAWEELFPTSHFKWLTHNEWYDFVKLNNPDGRWSEWIEYIGERYFKI